jgi:hypothetical protein
MVAPDPVVSKITRYDTLQFLHVELQQGRIISKTPGGTSDIIELFIAEVNKIDRPMLTRE